MGPATRAGGRSVFRSRVWSSRLKLSAQKFICSTVNCILAGERDCTACGSDFSLFSLVAASPDILMDGTVKGVPALMFTTDDVLRSEGLKAMTAAQAQHLIIHNEHKIAHLQQQNAHLKVCTSGHSLCNG